MVGSYVCFGLSLVLGHGYCGWPALPFALCLLVAASGSLLGHTELVTSRQPSLARGVHLVATTSGWIAILLWYTAIMLPPTYAPDHSPT